MAFDFSKYSFIGIQELCREHYKEIMQSHDSDKLKTILDNRRVRFINPLGYFDYAYFGDFTFDGDVMILWSKDIEYTRFHKPLHTSTLLSQVPVIFAGVDTKYRDDQNQEIFTGDVVTHRGYTSLVRYFGDSTTPGLAGDNCEILFEENWEIHKVGTVFSDIEPTLFTEFMIGKLYWPIDQFMPYGISQKEVIARASKSESRPKFTDDFKPQRRGRRLIYKQLSDVLLEEDVLCYLAKETTEDGETPNTIMCADNIPDAYHGELHTIKFATTDDFYDSIRTAFHEFLQYAHNNPERTFVLCDFKEALEIDDKHEEFKTAMQFVEWYKYKIHNVIVPFWILNNILTWDMIGKD